MQNLDQDRSLDAGARKLGAQIVRREVARKAITDRIGPRISVPAGPPEVMMRVDHVLIH
jgi:hypothetical protein